jgi:hypothetical protein
MSKKDSPGYPGDDAIKKAFGDAGRKIRSQFPTDVRAKLELYENANKTDDPAYHALLLKSSIKFLSVDWIHGPIQCYEAWEDGISTSIRCCKDEANSKQLAA